MYVGGFDLSSNFVVLAVVEGMLCVCVCGGGGGAVVLLSSLNFLTAYCVAVMINVFHW